ncbi:hypothetical protein MKW92_012065 [Papaver armeniacum]|nr:hypothetical protein MKW92_012065 [Papaver armeniacum]
MDSSNFTHFKPEIEKDNVLGFIPSQISEHQCQMVISEGFHAHSLINSNDESSSVLMVEMNNKEDFQEPISQLQNAGSSTQLDDSFIAEQTKETQEEISCKDSAKEEVCQKDEVFQVQDVVTGDPHLILVVETTQNDFIKSNSISPSQNLVELSNWGELSASGSNNKRMSAEIGSTLLLVDMAVQETMSSVDFWVKKRPGICSENSKKDVLSMFVETNSKKDVLSMFVEARNVSKITRRKKWKG